MKKFIPFIGIFSILLSSAYAHSTPKVDVLGMLDKGYISEVSPSGRYLLLGRIGSGQDFWLFDVNHCRKTKLPIEYDSGFFVNDRFYVRYANKRFRLWSTRTGHPVRTFKFPSEPSSEEDTQVVRSSPNGHEVWVLTSLHFYRFSTQSGKLLSELAWGDAKTRRKNHKRPEWCTLSANGHWIVSWENEWTMDEYEDSEMHSHNVKDEIIVYDGRTGRRAGAFAPNCSSVFSNVELQFTPVTGDIIQADDTQDFTYFQLPQGRKLWQWRLKEQGIIHSAPQGTFVAWKSPQGLVMRDLRTGRTLRRISNFSNTDGIPRFDRRGRYLFGLDRRGRLKRWHLQ